jgi:hypothetical protein
VRTSNPTNSRNDSIINFNNGRFFIHVCIDLKSYSEEVVR